MSAVATETAATTQSAADTTMIAASDPAAQTIAGGATPASTPATPADWMPEWREKMAGGDAKSLEGLKRFNSPVDLAKAYRELEKWKDGTKRVPELPEKPTDAELAEFRKSSGIPSDGKYNFDLGDGFIWAESDKPMLEDFSKYAFDTHMPEKEARKAASWHMLNQRKVAEEFAAKDRAFFNDSMNELSREWGGEFDENKNAAGLFLGRLPEKARYDLLTARTADGKVIGNYPDILRWAAQQEKALNPAATLLPASGGDPAATLEEEWDKAMDVRRSDPDKYWSKPFQKKVEKMAEAKAAMEERKRA